ncbi:hypothetical protein LCI18_005304 [Fusarium solani-melongenae]|uniref:Uncharacterized protein n=1 Tax=Fusarium solani subsp. cucurbitae TaxID=2747967 RepID=A0ACD3YZE7_FUSSC|nr:hypothetical protein LCI18_005304 [Fusarium solani-melongenae]
MGAGLSKIIKGIDGGDESAQETREALDALFELGRTRSDSAWAEAHNSAMQTYAAINQVLLRRQSIVASASTNTDGIVNGIKDSVGKLMSGQILDGVTDILASALNVVLGSSSGQVSQNYTYALICTELGAVLRIDIDIYSFELRSQGLQSKAKNMTAITSLVSSIKLNNLTPNDLRAIVSMSYGSSSLERQQAIYDVIWKAHQESNDPKAQESGQLSPEAQQRVKALFRPSEYEMDMKKRGTWLKGTDVPVESSEKKARVTRADLKEALKQHRDQVRLNKMASVSAKDGEPDDGAPPNPDATEWVDIQIWMKVTKEAEEEWLRQVAAVLRGFDEPDMFQFIRVNDSQSGSAITFLCQGNKAQKPFDAVVRYCQETIIPTLESYTSLVSSLVYTMALQYRHPGTKTGLVTVVTFKHNRINNKTNDDISFIGAKSRKILITIKAGESKLLTGPVHHILGPGKVDETDPEKKTEERQWVTRQELADSDIILSNEADITSLPGDGYRVTLHTTNDRVVNIDYNERWRV